MCENKETSHIPTQATQASDYFDYFNYRRSLIKTSRKRHGLRTQYVFTLSVTLVRNMGCKILPLLILAFAVVYVQAHDPQRSMAIVGTGITQMAEKLIGEGMKNMNNIMKGGIKIMNSVITTVMCKVYGPGIGSVIEYIQTQLENLIHSITKMLMISFKIMLCMGVMFVQMIGKLHGKFDPKLLAPLASIGGMLGSLLKTIPGLGGMLASVHSSDVSAGVHPGY